MKTVELLSRLIDEPLMNDVIICANVIGGKAYVVDIDLVFRNTKNQLVLVGDYKEKRETGIEPLPQKDGE